ncbi:MAG TPA: hypothetical protein VLH10_12240 [Yinghuangia sp.]|nr:hypothetical protein [Yinghuangia sp.]
MSAVPVKTRICFQLVCDADGCGRVLTDGGAPVHADSIATVVCPTNDEQYQAAYDAHLPPPPPRPTAGRDEINAAIAALRADPDPRIRAFGDRVAERYRARQAQQPEPKEDDR